MGKKVRCEIICRCNEISKETILKAIHSGAKTLNEIFDQTTAGVGPCGGSCRKILGPLLDDELAKMATDQKVPGKNSQN